MVAPVLQFGLPGAQEMIIILMVLVLLFGANKIPKLARSTGQAMGEFQKGREEVEEELQEIKEGGATSTDSTNEDEVEPNSFETAEES